MPIDPDDVSEDEDGFDDEGQVEGGESAMKKLLPFLAKWTTKNVESEEAEFPVVLFQTSNGSNKLLRRYKFMVGADDPEEFLNHILDHAERDASNAPGTTRYSVVIVLNGKERHQNFSLANLATTRGDGLRAIGDELHDPRTLSGHVGQMMRHEEAYADKLMHMSTENQASLREEIRELRQENRELRQQQREQIPLLAQVHDMSFRKELAIEEFKADQERKRAVTGMLMQALPHLASGMLGGGFAALLGGGGPPPDGAGAPTPSSGPPPGFGFVSSPNGAPHAPHPPGVVTGAVQTPPDYAVLTRIAMHVEGLLASLASNPAKLAGIAQHLEPMDQMTVGELHAGVEQLRAIRGTQAAPPPQQNGHANGHGQAYPHPTQQAPGGFVPFAQKPNAGT